MALSETETASEQETTCYKHPRRQTNVRCSNCDKPICSDCMRPSPVGMRCPDCAPRSNPIMRDDLIVTKTVIAICVIVFIAQVISYHRFTPDLLTGSVGGSVTQHGLLSPIPVYQGEWWRLFTSGFMHASVIHIAFNMYFIWAFGQILEPVFGRLNYALVFLAGIFGGSLAVVAFASLNTVTVGASTAGFCLLGAGLMMAWLRDHQELKQSLIGLAVINFVFSFAFRTEISLAGHVGGFVAGLVCGYIAFGPLARQRHLVTAGLIAVSIACFAGGVIVSHARVNSALQTQQQQFGQ
jgi:membrane associated rhomboid family serine protease